MIRDKKISILLFVSFLLLLASFLILCTWVYNYRSRDNVTVQAPPQLLQPSTDTRDSLIKIYTKSIQGLESQLASTFTGSDSMEASLSIKLDEFYKLKDEVATLLKNTPPSDDFRIARQKIVELQQRINELRNTSQLIQQENTRLHKLLARYNQEPKPGVQNTRFIETNTNTSTNGSAINEVQPAKTLVASDISLSALKEPTAEDDGFNTQRKIMGSFVLMHNGNLNSAELMVVVVQPNGQVLQKSAWESGSFRTKDGRKIYSVKINTDLNNSEAKKLSFSITTEKFLTGSYTLQIYSNGVLLGNINRQLS